MKGLAPKIVSDLFPLKEQKNYSLRQKFFFKIPRTKTVSNGFKWISYLGQKVWKFYLKIYCHH